VDDGAKIGDGTKVWHFCHVMGGAEIGRGCVLGQNVFVAEGAIIGNNVKLENNVSVWKACVLEDDVFVGPNASFTNVKVPRSFINRRAEYVPTLVRRRATIGCNSTIVCGVTIGEYAFVGAGAVVTHDVPEYAMVGGNPARTIGWACRCGYRLDAPASVTKGAKKEVRCAKCDAAYVLASDGLKPLDAKDR